MKTTWREIKEKLNTLTDDKLDQTAVVFPYNDGQMQPINDLTRVGDHPEIDCHCSDVSLGWAKYGDPFLLSGLSNEISANDIINLNKRNNVYQAINKEREYQDNLPANRTDGRSKSVGEYCAMITWYHIKLHEAWNTNAGDREALDIMRKIAGIAVHCMEDHGIVERS